MNKEKIVIVIPAYNEAKHIGKIIQTCRAYANEIIVVDDGSTDNTSDVARLEGVTCLSQSNNMGWGHAVQSGLKLCRGNPKYDIIVTLDADGQHDPNNIPLLIDEMRKSQSSIVIGSRFKDNGHDVGKIPAYRKFGINVINLIYNFGRKNKLTDTQSGFRAHRNNNSLYLKIEENGFAFSTEKLIKTDKLGFKISEVAIARIYHANLNENSSMNPIMHGLLVAIKTLIWRIRVEILREKIVE